LGEKRNEESRKNRCRNSGALDLPGGGERKKFSEGESNAREGNQRLGSAAKDYRRGSGPNDGRKYRHRPGGEGVLEKKRKKKKT